MGTIATITEITAVSTGVPYPGFPRGLASDGYRWAEKGPQLW